MLVGSSLCGLPIAWLLRTVYLICYGTLGRRRYTSRSERITQAELRSFAVFHYTLYEKQTFISVTPDPGIDRPGTGEC